MLCDQRQPQMKYVPTALLGGGCLLPLPLPLPLAAPPPRYPRRTSLVLASLVLAQRFLRPLRDPCSFLPGRRADLVVVGSMAT